jgi:hypothetical protein
MRADQRPGFGLIGAGGALQPVHGRRQTLRQAVAAAQITFAQRQLRLGLPRPGGADDCEIFSICHASPGIRIGKTNYCLNNRLIFKKVFSRSDLKHLRNKQRTCLTSSMSFLG